MRNLSIVMRQKASLQAENGEDRLRHIEAGLTRAREAVQLDTKDGISWSVLGNAYLAHFFSVSQNPRTLKQAMSAYKQAEKDMIALNTPELHHNKGIVSDIPFFYIQLLLLIFFTGMINSVITPVSLATFLSADRLQPPRS